MAEKKLHNEAAMQLFEIYELGITVDNYFASNIRN